MTAAAFTIFWMQIQLEWHSIIFCSLGAMFGMIFGRCSAPWEPPWERLGGLGMSSGGPSGLSVEVRGAPWEVLGALES